MIQEKDLIIRVIQKENSHNIEINLPIPYNLKRYEPLNHKKEFGRINKKRIYANPKISNKSGVYFLIKNNNLVYVGKTINIRSRISNHLSSEELFFNNIAYIEIEKEIERCLVESIYFMLYTPKHNVGAAFSLQKGVLQTIRKEGMSVFSLEKVNYFCNCVD